MAEMTGAQAMFEMMAREGVRYVFGNPGTTELPLMDLFADRGDIEYILALHEDSALGIAVGYAEASRTPAIVNLHTAPGLAHSLGNLYNAKRAGTPLIVTAGQQDTRAMIQEPLLYGDMLEAVRQYTKWSWEARHASDIPVALARAFKVATTPPTGPVFLSLPVNAMEERADLELTPVTRVSAYLEPDRASIKRAAELLVGAANPAIIAGDGCARALALPDVVRLAEILGARVYAEPLNSLLTFPTGHSLYAGPMFANPKQTLAQLEGVDVLLVLGVNLLAPLVYTGDPMVPAGVRLIQVDVDERELGKDYPAEIAIRADVASAAKELAKSLTSLLAGAAGEKAARRREIVEGKIRELRARFAEN
ncbi:MAG TPA: thiamine pyrophosphate-binding protein, partial [Blastocatellia bacterium]